MNDARTLNLDELVQYFVMGVDKEGKHVTAQSPNLSVQDMAAMLARANVAVQLQTVMSALAMYRQSHGAGNKASPIWTPDEQRKN